MNINEITKRIKLKLGIMNIATLFVDEKGNDNLDDVIVEIIQDITVPAFSIYQPLKENLHINLYDLELLEDTDTYEKYLLPDFQTRKLIDVIDLNYDTSILAGLGYYGGGMPLMEGNLIQQAMLSNAGASVMNFMIPKLTFKYEHPRTLYVYNGYSHSKVVLKLAFEHDKTLASIPETCREDFLKLALLDVKENLYPTLKQYSEINTAIGNINLKIDDWAQAEDQRRELIDKWDDTYQLDAGQPLYYI